MKGCLLAVFKVTYSFSTIQFVEFRSEDCKLDFQIKGSRYGHCSIPV